MVSMARSYLLEHMTNMIDAGVDMAFAWSLAHNTQNALIFRDEEITTASVHGLEIVTNSTRAAILDLMRQTVASHELIDATWSFGGTANDVEVTLFEDVDGGRQAGEGERIVFLSSRSPEAMSVTVDLTGFVPDCLLATASRYSMKTMVAIKEMRCCVKSPSSVRKGARSSSSICGLTR